MNRMITITEDLKARMDAAGKQINWSAIARDAFEAKLESLRLHREMERYAPLGIPQRGTNGSSRNY